MRWLALSFPPLADPLARSTRPQHDVPPFFLGKTQTLPPFRSSASQFLLPRDFAVRMMLVTAVSPLFLSRTKRMYLSPDRTEAPSANQTAHFFFDEDRDPTSLFFFPMEWGKPDLMTIRAFTPHFSFSFMSVTAVSPVFSSSTAFKIKRTGHPGRCIGGGFFPYSVGSGLHVFFLFALSDWNRSASSFSFAVVLVCWPASSLFESQPAPPPLLPAI